MVTDNKKGCICYWKYLIFLVTMVSFLSCTTEDFQNFTKDLPNKVAEHPQTLKAFEHYTSKGEKQKLAALGITLHQGFSLGRPQPLSHYITQDLVSS